MANEYVDLREAVRIHNAVAEYRDNLYLGMIQQINMQCKEILKDDPGSNFVTNCARDAAGEIVRTFMDTSSSYVTVDQVYDRIVHFSYDNDIDPLAKNDQIRKNVYNYSDPETSSRMQNILGDIDGNQAQLFELERSKDYSDQKGRLEFRNNQTDENGMSSDSLTGKKNEAGKLDADHILTRNGATVNTKYMTPEGVEALKKFYNSGDNFQMIGQSANRSKSDIHIYTDSNGRVLSQEEAKNYKGEKIEITHRATPEQMADATIEKWENATGQTRENLKNEGYLDENGKVKPEVRKKLIENTRNAQNKVSFEVLKGADYKNIAKDSFGHSVNSLGKIIGGQVIYYALPPIIYEIKTWIKDRKNNIDSVLERLKNAKDRFCNYIVTKLKDIFANISFNFIKDFVKSFMDILINMVLATVKKLIKLAKNLLMATVDSIRIIADKKRSAAEKADAVTNLLGSTITAFAVELLFEAIRNGLHLPEFLIMPLQIITTIICTNLTMLILQKVDLFDVRFGYKMRAIQDLFEQSRNEYSAEMDRVSSTAHEYVAQLIEQAKADSRRIYDDLMSSDMFEHDVTGDLQQISNMFNMNIKFEDEWLKFIGVRI